jgi:hypothetical protein
VCQALGAGAIKALGLWSSQVPVEGKKNISRAMGSTKRKVWGAWELWAKHVARSGIRLLGGRGLLAES